MNYTDRKIWHAACSRLAEGFKNGSLVLESRGKELRFRYVREPDEGFVIRRKRSAYAAIVAKTDWPLQVPLLRRGKRVA